RRPHADGSLLLVSAPLAMGRQRSAVRAIAGRSARRSGDGPAGRGAQWLALGRARAHRDAGHTVGPAGVSFTPRGRRPERLGLPRSAAAPRVVPPAETRVVNATAIGRVVATELKPSTPHEFHFWTATETSIGIGAIVKVGVGDQVSEDARVVYGVVTEGFAYSDLATPLHDVVGAEGDPTSAEAPTTRQQIRYWTAAVLRQTPEEPLQPVPLGQVYLADDADVAQALRMDAFLYSATPTAIPIGLYTSAGRQAPVYLAAHFLRS